MARSWGPGKASDLPKAMQEVGGTQGTVQAAGTTHPSLPFTPLQGQLPFQSDNIFYPLQIFLYTGFKCQIVL